MSLIIDHLEYLMRRHDCVTLPGIGALIARYIPAHFSGKADEVLLPPSRQLAFNGQLEQSDGLIERSVSRRSGISYEAAAKIVAEEATSLRSQLIEFGELSLGKLGNLIVDSNSAVVFLAAPASDWDCRFYGLKPLELTPMQSESASQASNILPAVNPYIEEEEQPQENKRGLTRKLIGVAASLAVVITLALSFFNPAQLTSEPEKASIAPAESVMSPAEETVSPDSETDEVNDASAVDNNADEAVTDDAASEIAAVKESANYFVIVASFPDEEQANRYIAQNPSRSLGVLNKDGKYRIYAASAATRAEAESLRVRCGQADAWVCAR